MATPTGSNLLTSILTSTGAKLSSGMQQLLGLRIQAQIDAGLDSPALLSATLFGASPLQIGAAANNNLEELQTIVTTEKAAIEAAPTYTIAADAASADEGTTASFTLSTDAADGTEVAYTLSGVDAADVDGGLLAGTVTVAAGKATISVALAADTTTEGEETLTVTAEGVSASTVINDTSLDVVVPTSVLTADAVAADEGTTATFTLLTESAEGTEVAYTLSGVDAADVDGGLLTGTATVVAGKGGNEAVISVALAADATTEGEETLTVTAEGVTANTTVNDTSVEVVPDTTAPVIADATADYAENQTKSTTAIATASATDDTAVTAYSITTGNDDGLFAIDAATGDITLTETGLASAANDFETEANSFALGITAEDAAGNSATATLTLNTTNDEADDVVADTTAPVIADVAVDYAENQVADAVIATASATDDTAVTAYSITTGNDDSLFAIDAATGAITLTETGLASAANDFETEANSFALGITAEDAAGNSATATLTLNTTNDEADDASIVNVSAAGTSDASTADTTFNFAAGTYEHTVDSFTAGDVLDFADGSILALVNNSNTDGAQTITATLGTEVVTLQLTGLATPEGDEAFGITSFNTFYGDGSLIA